MKALWKDFGNRANPRRWSGMVWAVVMLVMLCTVGTVVAGVKLYQITDRQVGFNPQ